MLKLTDLTTAILFIDASVDGYEHLQANSLPHIQTHILNPHQDGVQQITDALSDCKDHDRPLDLYIVTHGSPGWLDLGNTALSLSTLERYKPQLQSWFKQGGAGHLYLYACNAAAGDAGEELLAKLHHITGATIHGSTTKVGNAALGGDWELNAIAPSISSLSTSSLTDQPLPLSHPTPFSDDILKTYAGVLISLVNTDGDLIDDDTDLDDDNDGIPDEVEGPAPTDSGQDGSYAAADVAFAITGTVLDSITIDGTTYADLTTPDSYTSSFSAQGFNPARLYVINNGTEETTFGDSGTNWDADAIAPFASRDLNYYQGIDTAVSGTDYFELGYDVPVIATAGMFVAFTERNGNNSVTLQAYDADGNTLGAAVSVAPKNYIPMGISVTYGNNATQPLEVAIYPLDDLAPVGAEIAAIRVTPAQNNGDAADGKVFIFGDNTLQTSLDTDGDGIPNRLDLDSDNDGISDLVESGQDASVIDQNNDGIRDDIADNPASSDANNNGLADAVDGSNTITTPDDLDTDGVPNYLDLDADNDGIPDVVEAQPTAGYTSNGTANVDSDSDGVLDPFDTPGQVFGGKFEPAENTDGVDQPDYLDDDSDNDGSKDIDESGLSLLVQDNNNDGIDDAVQASYSDPDGLVNTPITVLQNDDLNDADVDYRSLDIEPPAATDDDITAPVGTSVTINPLANDPDNDDLDATTVVLTNPPPGSTLSGDGKSLTVPGQGTWSVDPSTGAITFTPVSGFTGTPTPVNYTVEDNNGARSNPATISINYLIDDGITNPTPGVPIAPTASDDVLVVTTAGQGSVNPLANDVDGDGSLDPTTVIFVNPPSGTSLTPDAKTLIVPGEGTWAINASTGLITFTPNAGVQGNPTPVQYTVRDNDGLISNAATIQSNFTIVAPERIRTIRSLSDPDSIVGDGEGNVINGGSQQDVISGQGGDDVINGGSGGDRLFGGQGNDLINGGSGDDRIKGEAGNDMINGGAGNDRLAGGRGKDLINGSDGDDKLFGQQKKDTLNGGAGDDLMIGGNGRDTMMGGQGRDRFRYRSTKEFRDVITDFEILKDTIDLRKIETIGSMSDMNMVQKGDDAIVQGWTGKRFKTVAKLESVDVGDLNESNFQF